MKKKLIVASVIVVLLSILGSGTLAYFTAGDTAHNVITSGGIDISIIEKTEQADGTLVDFPTSGLSGIMPGSSASKIVSVQNTGASKAWIRVQTGQEILAPNGGKLPLVLNGTIPVMTFGVDSTKWTQKDGWYYYHDPVEPGDVTDILFEEVRFAPEMSNAYQGCTANLTILAQAVQTANNGETALEAAGWPAA